MFFTFLNKFKSKWTKFPKLCLLKFSLLANKLATSTEILVKLKSTFFDLNQRNNFIFN